MNKKIYFICTTPRSGSNLLSDLLTSSKMMGQPREYLNPSGPIASIAKKNNLIDSNSIVSLEQYIDMIINKFSSSNNVCGIKIFFNQLDKFIDFPSIKKILQQCKFVFLTRRDIISQAVSLYIALETDIWKSGKEEKNPKRLVEYNEAKINKLLGQLIKQNINWYKFFFINQIDFLEITYEEILKNPNQYCQDICSYCGVDVGNYEFSLATSRYKKQSKSINQQFADTFCENYKLNIAKQVDSPKLELNGIKIV